MKVFEIFKPSKPSKLDLALEELFVTGGFKALAKHQMEAQAREQRKARAEQIREKYYFYKQRLEKGEVLKKDKYDEWIFTKFMMEDYDDGKPKDSTLFNSGIPYKEVSIDIKDDE